MEERYPQFLAQATPGSLFIEQVLLVEVGEEDNPASRQLVIFIDELDSFLGLDFPVNDLFALIRFCYNQRSVNPEYRRLVFALFGVATPSDLISDRARTPFNIGKPIELKGFQLHEAQPLLYGLTDRVSNPQVILKEVLSWTGGQPFLTQKICSFIRHNEIDIPINREAEWIENLVEEKIINYWESQDEPEHLRTIRDRIVHSERGAIPLLELYRSILKREEVPSTDSEEERELLLSGLVVKQHNTLRVYSNRMRRLIHFKNIALFFFLHMQRCHRNPLGCPFESVATG